MRFDLGYRSGCSVFAMVYVLATRDNDLWCGTKKVLITWNCLADDSSNNSGFFAAFQQEQ